jgi:hypothetical protein
MTQLEKAQKDQLQALRAEFKRLQKRLQAIHKKTGYEDLAHGVLALEIAEHTVQETLEHTGLGGNIEHRRDSRAYRQAKQWLKIVKGIKDQGNKFLRAYRSDDMETALKALEIAEGSLEEVAEHYE